MEIEFVGAAQTVTGSMHLVRANGSTLLLDCGLFQGPRRESIDKNQNLPLPIGEINAVVLSHAHIDHAGAIPMLYKLGYRGPVYATSATRDLAAVMLRDAAAIQDSDARFLNRQRKKEGREELVEPLYADEDVVAAIGRFVSVPYGLAMPIAPGITLSFLDAGHVLGSAITLLDIDERGTRKRVAFTGDLGRKDRPILRDPQVPEGVDVLLTESTYGDRLHDPGGKMEEDLAVVVKRTIARGGKVLIPAFALERAQEVVFALKKLRRANLIPHVPVFVDSPLTVRITDVFKLHPECYDAETRALMHGHDSPFDFDDLRYVEDVEGSKGLDASDSPSIIISASGMCEAGRILHHLKNGIEDERNTILIVGYQAQHTLGRRLVEGRLRVKVFGVERDRRAEVQVLNGFSAHADQKDLVAYAKACAERGPLSKVALVHGELKAQQVLADVFAARGLPRPTIPARGDRLTLA
jgi:metallo-beta-lactamase family protein